MLKKYWGFYKMEIKNIREIETEEGFAPLPRNICPECKHPFTKIGNTFKCIKCGITIENAERN